MNVHNLHLSHRARLLAWFLVGALVLGAGVAAAPPRVPVTAARLRQVFGSGATAAEHAAGNVRLRGTLGQPIAGTPSGSGGQVALRHGFWGGGAAGDGDEGVYLPLVLHSYR